MMIYSSQNVVCVAFALVASAFLMAVGCSSGPDAIEKANYDPAAASNSVFGDFDGDKNGQLNAQELAKLPGVKDGLSRIDKNGDGQISETELQERITMYVENSAGLQQARATVYLDDKPFPGANVLLEPEPFLEGVIEPAKGTTDASGSTALASQMIAGAGVMRPGMYRVKITSPSKKLPAKYNENTELGVEFSGLNEGGRVAGEFEFRLKSR